MKIVSALLAVSRLVEEVSLRPTRGRGQPPKHGQDAKEDKQQPIRNQEHRGRAVHFDPFILCESESGRNERAVKDGALRCDPTEPPHERLDRRNVGGTWTDDRMAV